MRRKLSRLGISLMSLLCMCFLVLAINVFAADETHTTDCERFIKAYKYDDAISYINDGKEDTYPTKEGFLFAGWYTDETCENEYWGQEKPGEEVYALFLPSHVLSVKAQVSANLLNDGTSDDASASIRLVTSIDTLLYKEAGFEISYTNGETTKNVTKSSNMVYERLHAVKVGTDSVGSAIYEENGKEYTPQDAFCNLSTYFKACTVKNVPASGYITQFTVKPFWYTVDGSKVYGETATKSISEYFAMEDVYVSTTGADTLKNGTEENPFATLEYALGMVADGGTIHIVDSYTATDAFVWKEHGKSVTISGGTIDFTALPVVVSETEPKVNASMLHIGDSVTFENTILKFASGAHVFAQGHTLEITENVSFSEKITLCGGAYLKPITGNTNLILKSGEYTTIYGGGFGGKVTGNTYITLSGTVNETADYTSHESNANKGARKLFGGGYGAPITGNTNIKVQSSAVEFNYIFGGGHYNAVNGDTHIEYAGSAMALFGGGLSGTVAGNTYITMTDGWAHQIFGGCHSREMTGSANIDVQGGTVERRVYGGCYNEEGDNGWSNYCVNGYATVKISKDATLDLDYWKGDNSVVSISRGSAVSESEKGVFLFCDYENNGYVDQIGPDYLAMYDGVVEQSYNYLVKAEANGTVSADGNYLIIKPNEGLAAKVIIDKNVVHYAENETAYKLPALDSSIEKKEILIEFDVPDTSIDTTKHEAKIGASYYETLEEAVNAAEVLSTENKNVVVTLLDNVEVESTMSIDENANVTVESDEGKQYTINRATALVDADGEIFTVSDGNTLTVNNIVLDGRTALGVGSENEDHNATLIYSAGTVNVTSVTAQYATGAAIQTKGANAVTKLETVTITNPGGNGFVATSGTTIAKDVEIRESGTGGISVGSAATVYLDAVTLNTIGSGTSHHGIYNDGGIIKTVENAEEAITIQNVVGHAVANVNSGTIILKGMTIQNVTGTDRDGVYSNDGIVTIMNVAITDVKRGGITVAGTGKVIANNVTVMKSDEATDTAYSSTYGIYSYGDAAIADLTNVIIEDSKTAGVYAEKGTVLGEEITITRGGKGVYSKGGTLGTEAIAMKTVTIQNVTGHGIHTENGRTYLEGLEVLNVGRKGVAVQGGIANIEDATINGTGIDGTAQSGIFAGKLSGNAADVNLNNVIVKNTTLHGIEADASTVTVNANGINIDSVAQHGISNINSGTVEAKKITIGQTTKSGVYTKNSTTKIYSGTITGSGENGIHVASGSSVVKGVGINNVTLAGIRIEGGTLSTDNVTVTGGSIGIESSGGTIKLVDDATSGVAINNTTQYGIKNTGNSSVVENVEIVGGVYGIGAEGGLLTMKNVSATGTQSAGIHLMENGTIYSNAITITNPATYGIEGAGGTITKIENAETGVIINGATKYALYNVEGISIVEDVEASCGTKGIGCLAGTLDATDVNVSITSTNATYGAYVEKEGTVLLNNVSISGGYRGIYNDGGTIGTQDNPITKVTIQGCSNHGFYNVGGTVNADDLTVKNITRKGVVADGGTTNIKNSQIDGTGEVGIFAYQNAPIVNLDNVTVKNVKGTVNSKTDQHGIDIKSGTVTVSTNLIVNTTTGHGISITGGSLLGGPINVSNSARCGIYATKAINITGVTITGCTQAIGAKSATITINNVSLTAPSTTTYYSMSDFTSN